MFNTLPLWPCEQHLRRNGPATLISWCDEPDAGTAAGYNAGFDAGTLRPLAPPTVSAGPRQALGGPWVCVQLRLRCTFRDDVHGDGLLSPAVRSHTLRKSGRGVAVVVDDAYAATAAAGCSASRGRVTHAVRAWVCGRTARARWG